MVKVLVADDSALFRRAISSVLEGAGLEVVGTARDGEDAVAKCAALAPDVVTLDIEMPRLDGLAALPGILAARPGVRVVMVSTLTEHGAAATLEALARGAHDYVAKPASGLGPSASMRLLGEELVPRVRALAGVRRAPAAPAPAAPPAPPRHAGPPAPVRAVVVAASTGGPEALARLVPALPGDLGVPVLLAQHMPPVFTGMLARRLDGLSALTVREAGHGEPVRAGEVLVAPGDHHLRVVTGAEGPVAALDQGEPENFCRPAADPLLRSAVATWGPGVLAVVLTGMGHDGLAGVAEVVAAGGRALVQDRAGSVVWGMPGAVADAGLATAELPVEELAAEVVRRVRGGH